jgi:hypothetical protein
VFNEETRKNNPPPHMSSLFFIGPSGWWNMTGWNYGWWYNNYYYNNIGGYWAPRTSDGSFVIGNWFGPWGYEWWTKKWGDRPPTQDQVQMTLGDGTDTPPESPCGQTRRRYRYGFVVWEWGFPAIQETSDSGKISPGRRYCLVSGGMQYRNRTVIENGEVPEPS